MAIDGVQGNLVIVSDGVILFQDKSLFADLKFMKGLVQIRADYLKYGHEHVRSNPEVALAAAGKDNNKAIEFIDRRLFNNRSFVLQLVKLNGNFLAKVSEDLRADKAVVLSAVSEHA